MEYKLPQRIENSNKSTYGRVLNIAGSQYMTGAAYLSSVSALKIGCGYCFLCSCERVIDAVAAKTNAIVFVPLDKLEQNIKNADVTEIGCGLGVDETARNIFITTLNNADISKPLIIDADGLNILSDIKEDFINKGFKQVILTPHPKEASRLLGCKTEDVLNNIEYSAKQISDLYNCVTVLKTNKTYIYSPEYKNYTNTTGNNAMAKAGSGDVLTGMISGLTAQGTNIFEAACLGVYLHGKSGDFASENLTQYCVMPDDLIDYIPQAVKTLI